MPSSATVDYLRQQAPIPSDLRTEDWDRVPLWVRERSFFMAAVDDAEVLQLYQSAAIEIADGTLTNDEAARRIRDQLDARGYAPEPGQEGTIKDLRSLRRINIALDTNVAMARGYGAWKRQQGALRAFPAQRYIRGRQAMVPRDWPARWNRARALTFDAGATAAQDEDSMSALVNHPLWTEPGFNRFGAPWPPFDWRSGMTVAPMSRTDARAAGLLPDRDTDPDAFAATRALLQPQDRALNESLQARPAVTTPALRDALARRLRGYAEWSGDDTLVFTDPNGTRPGTVPQVADIITRPLPIDPGTGQPFPRHQLDALLALAEDPDAFAAPGSRYRNRYQDLARLIRRVADPEQTRRLMVALADYGDANAAGIEPWLANDLIPRLLESPLYRGALARDTITDLAADLLGAILSVL